MLGLGLADADSVGDGIGLGKLALSLAGGLADVGEDLGGLVCREMLA